MSAVVAGTAQPRKQAGVVIPAALRPEYDVVDVDARSHLTIVARLILMG